MIVEMSPFRLQWISLVYCEIFTDFYKVNIRLSFILLEISGMFICHLSLNHNCIVLHYIFMAPNNKLDIFSKQWMSS